MKGIEGARTMRLRGFLANQEVYMLVDSGSTHYFISEEFGNRVQAKKALTSPVQVRVVNGNLLQCTHELPNQMWNLQGITFTNTFKIMSLSSYDVVLGMDWLESNIPMEIHWGEKWLQIKHKGKPVRIQGIQPQAIVGPPVTPNQLDEMIKQDFVLYYVQLNSIAASESEGNTLPEEIQTPIDKYSSLFQPLPGLPPKRDGDHTIPLMPGASPFRLRPYRYNPFQKDEIEKQIQEMLDKGLIKHSSSPFSSPALLVRKKAGDWRLCVDYRRLNALTVKNKYPLPIIDELLDELHGAAWFSSLDLCFGFHQIRMVAGHEYKTAFKLTIATMSIK